MSNVSQSLQRQSETRSFSRQYDEPDENGLGREIEDLIHSWRRIADPALRQIALNVIRAMASR